MNVVFFDPSYMDQTNLTKLGDILKICVVYCCMPMIQGDYKIKNSFGDKVKLWRRSNETLESVKKRVVYAMLKMVSEPIIVDGNFIGKNVYDVFVESKADSFRSNLDLQDPNILILIPDDRLDREESDTIIFRYFYNILKKYDKTDRYIDRIAKTTLSPFICLNDSSIIELQGIISSCRSFDFQKNNAQLLLHLLMSYNCRSVQELRKLVLLPQEELKRKEIIDEIKEEELREREDAKAYYDDGLTEEQRWGADSEMGYIRNNGGDWIDD